jgi:ankyrin repeat protein
MDEEGPVKELLRNALAGRVTIDRTAAGTADGAAAANVGPGSSLTASLCWSSLSLLILAVDNNNEEIARLLLSKGADIHFVNEVWHTAK